MALKDGKWSAESAAKLSNDEFFEIIGIPELTSEKAAKPWAFRAADLQAEGLPQVGTREVHQRRPPPRLDLGRLQKDAVALLGSEEAVQAYIEGKIDPPEGGEVGGSSPSGNNGGGSTDLFGNPVHEKPRQQRLF